MTSTALEVETFQPSPPDPEVTDCPLCTSLCLSPTILPCGHLVCRKCLRHILETQGPNPACLSCKRRIPRSQGQTISELADQLGKDLILEDLVIDKLAKQRNVTCVSCKKTATKLCLDCGENYCSSCSSAHKGMSMSKDHMQQDHHGMNALTAGTQSKTHTHLNESSDLLVFDTPPPTAQGEPSPDSASPDASTRSAERDLLRMEARLCEDGVAELRDAASAIEISIRQLQEVKNRLDREGELMSTYLTRLNRPDDALLANARAMLPRLRLVRANCRPPQKSAVNALTAHIQNLVNASDVSHGTSYDPMNSVPRKMFTVRPDADGDTHTGGPGVSSIICTHDGRLVMADLFNRKVKVTEVSNPATTMLGVRLEATPYRLALLCDGLVAVTTDKKCIYFIDVSGPPAVVSHVLTSRRYWGIGCVTEDDTLVVSCVKDMEGPASVDVIARNGDVLKIILDITSLPLLSWPHYLCVYGRKVLVSDLDANAVFSVEMDRGAVTKLTAQTDLRSPWQMAVDEAGSCYICSTGSQCVLVVTPSGQWRRLLHGPDDGDTTRVKPVGVCVTSWGVVVTWDEPFGYSAVVGYDLT